MDRPVTADGTLVIMVCRAKHLPNRRKLDKQSPYVLLRIGLEAQKTPSHFRAGQTPEWTHELRFQLVRDRRPLMRLDVLDETKSEPTPIGGTDLDCADVFGDRANFHDGKYILDGWHDLRCDDRPSGKIYLEMTFYPSAPVVPGKVPSAHQTIAVGPHQLSPAYLLPQRNLALPAHTPLGSPSKATSPVHKPLPRPGEGEPNGPSVSADSMGVFVSENETKKRNWFRLSDPGLRFQKLKEKLSSREPVSALWASEPKIEKPSALDPEDLGEILPIGQISPGAYHSPVQRRSLRPEIDFVDFRHNYSESIDFPPPVPPHSAPPSSYGLEVDCPPVPPKSQTKSQGKSPTRRPPPGAFESSTSIPFSAASIGVDEEADDLPTKVYHMGQAVQSLTVSADDNQKRHINPNEIDPKHYAPTPTEELAQNMRLQYGQPTRDDLAVDLNTESSGYLGDGKWDLEKRFLPSVFERINDENGGSENKPRVPPKIPRGLSEMEYYVLEKEKFLRDINGRRH